MKQFGVGVAWHAFAIAACIGLPPEASAQVYYPSEATSLTCAIQPCISSLYFAAPISPTISPLLQAAYLPPPAPPPSLAVAPAPIYLAPLAVPATVPPAPPPAYLEPAPIQTVAVPLLVPTLSVIAIAPLLPVITAFLAPPPPPPAPLPPECPVAGPPEPGYSTRSALVAAPAQRVVGQWNGTGTLGTMTIKGEYLTSVAPPPEIGGFGIASAASKLDIVERWKCSHGIWDFVEASGSETITTTVDADLFNHYGNAWNGSGTEHSVRTVVNEISKNYERKQKQRNYKYTLSSEQTLVGMLPEGTPDDYLLIVNAEGSWTVTIGGAPNVPDIASGQEKLHVSAADTQVYAQPHETEMHCTTKINGPEPTNIGRKMLSRYIRPYQGLRGFVEALDFEDDLTQEHTCETYFLEQGRESRETFVTQNYKPQFSYNGLAAGWAVAKKSTKLDSLTVYPPVFWRKPRTVEQHVLQSESRTLVAGKIVPVLSSAAWKESAAYHGHTDIHEYESRVVAPTGNLNYYREFYVFTEPEQAPHISIRFPTGADISVGHSVVLTPGSEEDFADPIKLQFPLTWDDLVLIGVWMEKAKQIEELSASDGMQELEPHHPDDGLFADIHSNLVWGVPS